MGIILAAIGGFLTVVGSFGISLSFLAGNPILQPVDLLPKITFLVGVLLLAVGLFLSNNRERVGKDGW